MSRSILAILAVVLAFCLPASALAPPSPQDGDYTQFDTKGTDPNHSYLAIGGAEVDAFNFNLSVAFDEPVGFPQVVDGGLSVTLRRVYNSRVYQERGWGEQEVCSGTGELEVDAPHKWQYLSIPRQNPMGLGWELHLGHIYKQQPGFRENPSCRHGGQTAYVWNEGNYAFVSSDGGEHILIKSEAESSAPGETDDVYYTHDGSAIRARRLNRTGTWRVYLPTGTIMDLEHEVTGAVFDEVGYGAYFTPGNPGTGQYDRDKIGWWVSRIRTREVGGSGTPMNFVAVAYHAAPFDYVIAEITDSHHGAGVDRSIDVAIDTTPGDASYGHVTNIEFPAPPSEGGLPRRLLISFGYEQLTLTISKVDEGPWTQAVSVLTSVRLPSEYGYGFAYRYHETPLGAVRGFDLPEEIDFGGRLKDINYPSGKLVRLTYGRFYRGWKVCAGSATT